MGYQNDEREPSKGKLAAIGGVLLVLLAGGIANVVGRTAAREGIDAYQHHDAISKIDNAEQEGPMAEMLQELRKVDPERADAMKAELRRVLETASSPQDAKARMMEYSRNMMADYRAAAPNASDAGVRKIAETQLTALKVLRARSEDDCGRMAMSGPWAGLQNTPEFTKAMADASVNMIRYGAEGLANPVKRREPNDAEYVEIGERMVARGVSSSEMDAIGNGTLGGLPAATQCRVVTVMFEQALEMDSPAVLATLITQ